MSPPFAANHFSDAAFSAVIQSIWRSASPSTRPWYDLGAVSNGDNWIILWMLYHACRYRDARNSKATSRNFHDDDDLDDNGSEGKVLVSREINLPWMPLLTYIRSYRAIQPSLPSCSDFGLLRCSPGWFPEIEHPKTMVEVTNQHGFQEGEQKNREHHWRLWRLSFCIGGCFLCTLTSQSRLL